MSNVLNIGGHDQVDVETVAADDAEFQDGDGNSTTDYNSSGAGSTNDVTFIRTNLARVDQVMGSVQSPVDGVGAGAIQVHLAPASEAVEDDLDGLGDDEEYGLVKVTLLDTSDGSEIGSDTDVTGLEITYTAARK